MPTEKSAALSKQPKSPKSQEIARFVGRGLTSKREITVKMFAGEPGTGVVFAVPANVALNANDTAGDTASGPSCLIEIPASVDSVVNTLRNVTIGRGKTRICIVEHFLCATALSGLNDLYVEIDGPELPLGNGSCDFWMALFTEAGMVRPLPQASLELREPITISRGDRVVMAVPSDSFSVTYLMDWDHPKIGRLWRSWSPAESVEEITMARTFSSLAEHELLGLVEDVVSITEDDFTMPLRFADEPVRHKLLDLIGDLMLCGINPLLIKARFVSIKGGHEMDVTMARQLRSQLKL